MEKQSIGGEDEPIAGVTLELTFKNELQKKMIDSSTSFSGFMMWLDFTRDSVTSNEFLLCRPELLPKLDAIQEVVDEMNEDAEPVNENAPVSTKLVKHAQTIASVARNMLGCVKSGIVTVAPESDKRHIYGKRSCCFMLTYLEVTLIFNNFMFLEINSDFHDKIISFKEREWLISMSTANNVLNHGKLCIVFLLLHFSSFTIFYLL